METYKNTDKIISHLNDEIEECGDADVYLEPVAYGTRLGLLSAKAFIETAETADVQEVRHGHWFILEYEYFTCSECGYYHPNGCDSTEEAKEKLAKGNVPKYCDECGAKMDGRSKEMDKKPKVCFDCINCEQCPTGLACSANPACTMFKDKSRFVELPCKVGDVVYCFAPCFDADHRPRLKVVEREIIRLKTTLTVSGLISDIDNIGKTVFLTREEAERALKDMRKDSNGGKIND